MKKIFTVAAVLMAIVLTTGSAQAQDVKGKNFVNAGIGLGTYAMHGTGGIPLTLSAEHGFTDKVSAGLYFGMIQRNLFGVLKYNYKIIGVRGSYHFNELLGVTDPKVDVYGGASLYYRSFTVKYNFDSPDTKEKSTSGDIGFGIHAAARYMFSPKIGGFAEVGYGVSPLHLGVTAVF